MLPVDVDMFLYVNAKFAYFENHIRASMRNMYVDILKQKCEVERKNILTKQSLAMVSREASLSISKRDFISYVTVHIEQREP